MFHIKSCLKFFAVALLLSPTSILDAQSAANAPANVRIKAASDSDVAKAKAMLQTALTTETVPHEWETDPTIFGPTLWKTLGPLANPKDLEGATTVTVIIDAKPPIHAEGRAARTPAHHIALWKLLLKTYPALKTATPRPATAKEIMYFWATIPIDIEEPLFALDAGADTFIVNTPRVHGEIGLFWIDRVAPYEELRPKP